MATRKVSPKTAAKREAAKHKRMVAARKQLLNIELAIAALEKRRAASNQKFNGREDKLRHQWQKVHAKAS